ncbi:MAG TPA: hypothetical protein VH643_22845 [Gemmataceae bacterium]
MSPSGDARRFIDRFNSPASASSFAEAATRVKQRAFGDAFPFLMLVIDKAAEK